MQFVNVKHNIHEWLTWQWKAKLWWTNFEIFLSNHICINLIFKWENKQTYSARLKVDTNTKSWQTIAINYFLCDWDTCIRLAENFHQQQIFEYTLHIFFFGFMSLLENMLYSVAELSLHRSLGRFLISTFLEYFSFI